MVEMEIKDQLAGLDVWVAFCLFVIRRLRNEYGHGRIRIKVTVRIMPFPWQESFQYFPVESVRNVALILFG